MLDAFIENLQSALTDWFGYPWIAVVILAMMPIVEARLAVPMAMACGYKAWQSFFIGFLGSSLPAPLLLLVLIPFIKWQNFSENLAKPCTKSFKRNRKPWIKIRPISKKCSDCLFSSPFRCR